VRRFPSSFVCARLNNRAEPAPEFLQFLYGRSPYPIIFFRAIGRRAFVEINGSGDLGNPGIDPELEQFPVEFHGKVLLKDFLE
jgi:hypothetical protein